MNSNQELHFSGDVQCEDFFDAFSFHQRKTQKAVFLLIFLTQIPFGLILLRKGFSVMAMAPLLGPVIGLVIGLLSKKHTWKRFWLRQKHLYDYRTGLLNDQHICFLRKDGTKQVYEWPGLIGYRTNPYLILIYLNKNQFLIVLRNMFHTEADWQSALDLVSQQLPKKFRKLKNLDDDSKVKGIQVESIQGIPFSGTPTFRDYFSGLMATYQNLRWWKVWVPITCVIPGIIFLTIMLSSGQRGITNLWVFPVVMLFLIPVIMALVFLCVIWFQRRLINANLTILAGQLSNNSLFIQTVQSNSQMPLASFQGRRTSYGRIFLFVSPYNFIAITRGMCESEDDWDTISQTITETVPVMGTKMPRQGICVECGCELNKNTGIAFGENMVCITCKPNYVQKLMEGAED